MKKSSDPLIEFAHVGKMLADLKPSDSNLCWLATIFNSIYILSSQKDPTPIHFVVAREVLGESKITDNKAVDILARKLLIACKELKRAIKEEFSETDFFYILEEGKGELVPQKDSTEEFRCEKDGYNRLDLVLCKQLKTTGKAGKSAANNITNSSRERCKSFEENRKTPKLREKFWEEWILKRTKNYSICGPHLYTIASSIWKDIGEKEWKNSQAITTSQKVPISLFNVILTNRNDTLSKIKKNIDEFKKDLKKTTQPEKIEKIQTRIKIAQEIYEKANLNFPEDFRFSVYEQYAIYGGLKILNDNKFTPTEITFASVLESLGFEKINKKEITNIKQAFTHLTKNKFPCYMVHPDRQNPQKYTFYDGDEPIFKIWEFGTVDLSVDLDDEEIHKKRLVLSLGNGALITNIKNFYAMINSNIIAQLRSYKKVSEDDLYLLAYILKEYRFKPSTDTTLHKLCSIIKKTDWLENEVITNRDHKRRVKEKVVNILDFAKSQNLISTFKINKENVKISYSKTLAIT